MYDHLSLDGLTALHHQLATEFHATHDRMMDGAGLPRIPVFSNAWRVLAAKCDEISETMDSVYAEFTRRQTADADA